MSYRGTVKDGVVALEPGVDLPDGTAVRVEHDYPVKGQSSCDQALDEDPLLRKAEVRGTVRYFRSVGKSRPLSLRPCKKSGWPIIHSSTARSFSARSSGASPWPDSYDSPPRASATSSLNGLPDGCSPQIFLARARKSGYAKGTTLAMTLSCLVTSTSSPAATHSRI
jgi:hypothetical protein